MKLTRKHGRKGTGTEYYEYAIIRPKVVVQRVGERWLLGVIHTDGTWQIHGYFARLDIAQHIAKKLVQQYATGETYRVADDRQLCTDLIEQYAHVEGALLIVDTTGRDEA